MICTAGPREQGEEMFHCRCSDSLRCFEFFCLQPVYAGADFKQAISPLRKRISASGLGSRNRCRFRQPSSGHTPGPGISSKKFGKSGTPILPEAEAALRSAVTQEIADEGKLPLLSRAVVPFNVVSWWICKPYDEGKKSRTDK